MNYFFDRLRACFGHPFEQRLHRRSLIGFDAGDGEVLFATRATQVGQPRVGEVGALPERVEGCCNAFGLIQRQQLESCGALVRAALPEFVDGAGAGWDAFNLPQPTARRSEKPLDKTLMAGMIEVRPDTRLSVSPPVDWKRSRPSWSTQFQVPEAFRLTSGALFARSSFSELCVLSYFRCFLRADRGQE